MDTKRVLIEEYKKTIKRYNDLTKYEKTFTDEWGINYINNEKREVFAAEDSINNIAKKLGYDDLELRHEARVELSNEEAH